MAELAKQTNADRISARRRSSRPGAAAETRHRWRAVGRRTGRGGPEPARSRAGERWLFQGKTFLRPRGGRRSAIPAWLELNTRKKSGLTLPGGSSGSLKGLRLESSEAPAMGARAGGPDNRHGRHHTERPVEIHNNLFKDSRKDLSEMRERVRGGGERIKTGNDRRTARPGRWPPLLRIGPLAAAARGQGTVPAAWDPVAARKTAVDGGRPLQQGRGSGRQRWLPARPGAPARSPRIPAVPGRRRRKAGPSVRSTDGARPHPPAGLRPHLRPARRMGRQNRGPAGVPAGAGGNRGAAGARRWPAGKPFGCRSAS